MVARLRFTPIVNIASVGATCGRPMNEMRSPLSRGAHSFATRFFQTASGLRASLRDYDGLQIADLGVALRVAVYGVWTNYVVAFRVVVDQKV